MDLSKFMKPHSLEEVNPDQPLLGFGIHESISRFNNSFLQSGAKLLDDFIKEHKTTKKWILSSDYAFYDPTKNSDVVTFSLFPHLASFETMSECINIMAPSDLKNVRSVNDTFISFLKEGPVFNITLILDRERRMHSDERLYHISRIDAMIGMLEYLCTSTPKQENKYKKTIKELKQLKQMVKSSKLNLRILRDIEIVASLAAYFLAEISERADVEIISWLSDRDSMLTFKNKLIGDYMLEQVSYLYHTLCLYIDVDPKGKLILTKPETEGELSYDSFVRVPDYIAGTLADFDFEKQEASHPKFDTIRDGVFAAEKRNIFYKVFFHPDFQAHRLMWGAQEGEISKP
ncbi:hypothetical protein O999_23155 [Pseudomonas putida LF54]|uniref:hypothetical protein n=1 Tax=Pseudomonas putida TaxID=303 RepID=UPI0003AEEEA5|nr:hypothetical protein [Pseudomonas putida]ERL01336.1 hypothetical protein O999_23155 [Pseudomonas putida LF54]